MKVLKKLFPTLFIFAIWFIFSSPYFLQNKIPFPSRYLVNFFSPWVAYPGYSSPVKNNAMPDVISQIYPWKSLTVDLIKDFQVPLWNSYSFSGAPHLANYQSAVLSPFNLIFFVLPFIDAWSILVLLQPFLAGFFMYLYLQSLKLSKNASIFGAISFMFCGFITTWMAYATLSYAILFLPLALFAIEKYYQNQRRRFLILLSASFPLSFFSGHFQISIYFFIFVFLYIFFKFLQEKDVLKTGWLLSFSLIGVLLSLPQLLPSIELYSKSLRSGIFQKIEAIPWGYLPTFIAPDFLGNPVTRNDWFGHYAEWNSYVGVTAIMLSFYTIIGTKTKIVWFFLLTAILAILFSFQTPFLDLLVLMKIPVLSTSAASRIIVIFSFSAVVLGALGFDKLFEDIKNKKNKSVFYLIFIFLTIFVSLWFVVLFKLFIPLDKITIAKQNLILPTLIFISTSLLIVLAVFLKNKRNVLKLLPFILIIIIAFDMLRFSSKWMPFDPKNLMYPNLPISQEFNKISGFERVLGNLGGEATIYYKLPTLVGYDAVYIKRYGEFIASLETGKLSESSRSVVSIPENGLYTPKALNLLGVKYIVNKKSDGHAVWNFPYWTYPIGTFKTIYQDEAYQIFENTEVFPRAFLVNKYVVESNPQKILDTMFSSKFDLSSEVVLEEKTDNLNSKTLGYAKIDNYTSNKISISTSSNGKSLLFLSDTYYPGWEAYVDGRQTKILRTDFTFRSVLVPAGKHKVEFIYNPLSFRMGVIGFIAGIVTILWLGFIKRRVI